MTHKHRQLQALQSHSMTSQRTIQHSNQKNPQVSRVLCTGLRWGCRVSKTLTVSQSIGTHSQCAAENQATIVHSTNTDSGALLHPYSNYSTEILVINISAGNSRSTSENFGGSYQRWKVLFCQAQKNGRAK